MKKNLLQIILLAVVLVPFYAEAAGRRVVGAVCGRLVVAAGVTTGRFFCGCGVRCAEPGPDDVDRFGKYDCTPGGFYFGPGGTHWVDPSQRGCGSPDLVVNGSDINLLAELVRLQQKRVIIKDRVISEEEWLALRKLVKTGLFIICTENCSIQYEGLAEPAGAYLAFIPDGQVVAV